MNDNNQHMKSQAYDVAKRRLLQKCQSVFALLAVVPFAAFILAVIFDPPSSSPGGFGGGFLAALIFYLGGPISIFGLVAFLFTRYLLIKLEREAVADEERGD